MKFWNWNRVRFYARALSYFRADSTRIVALLGLIGISTLLGLLQVWPLAVLVDSVLSPSAERPWVHRVLLAPADNNLVAQIVFLAGLTLALRLSQELLNLLRTVLTVRIGHNGLLRVRCDLFQKLQDLHLHYHRSRSQGDTLYRLSNDANSCQAILNVFVNVAVAAVTLVIMFAIMVSRNMLLTAIALAVIPLLLALNLAFAKMLKIQSSLAKQLDSQFTSTVQRSLGAITLVQVFSRQPHEYLQFRRTATDNVDAWYRFHWQFALYRLLVGIVFGGGAALIFGVGGYLVYRDQVLAPRTGGMTVGDLMIFLTYLSMFYDPLCKLSGAGASVQEGVAGAERVFEILDHSTLVSDRADAVALPLQPRTLQIQNTSFNYPGGAPVLRDISVEVQPGEMVAFVGSSGVGKSTLLNLLPRFFDPTRGSLSLDGHDLRDLRLADLRRHITVVFQDSLMLPTSIAENISYGRPGASEAEIRRAAEMAGAASFIESLPEQYQTVLTEAGQNLSGGQRQRIAIARALLTDAPILVLDEPTSALDVESERLIAETLRSLKGQRTIILVSHRLGTVVDCDQIFVMHGGRIVNSGNHRSLLSRRGWYYEMARHQLQDEPTEAQITAA